MLKSAHRPAGTAIGGRRFRGGAAVALLGVLLASATPWAKAADDASDSTSPLEVSEQPRPLHQRINDALSHGVATTLPDLCSDETFIRRTSLDFRGLTPTADEIRAFSADPAPDKRSRLLDTFLADPHHTRHLAAVLDITLMERRAEKHVKTAEWRAWLRQQAAARTPWDELVRTLLVTDGADEGKRGAARWLLDREAEPNALARDVSRLFLGMDLSCAQCHDHPRIADYWQRDYQELLAFFNRTYLFQPDPMKPAVVGEHAAGEVSFTSVFTKIGGAARPRLPGGEPVSEPAAPPDQLWVVAPNEKDKAVRPVPRYSRRAALAQPLTTSRAFALNAANRFWAVLLGRGVIEPVDLRHTANPPAADALLDVLADGIVALKYDVSAYWREVAMSRAYQAPYDAPATVTAGSADPAALHADAETATAAEQDARRRETAARDAWEPLQLAAQSLEAETAAAAKTVAEARPPAEAAAAAFAETQKAVATKAELVAILETAAAQCAEAARVVADAPELVRAATVLQSRLNTAKTEHDALTTMAAAKETDHATKNAALTAAEATAAAVAPRLAAGRAAAETAWKAVAEAATTARTARDSARRATRDATRASALDAADAAARHSAETSQRLAATQHAAQVVAGAVTSARAACEKLPEDQELATVFTQIQSCQAAATAALDADSHAAEAAAAVAAAATAAMVPRWTEGFALASLTPLSPEQLCWSVLRATGTLDQLRAHSAREWDEKNPVSADPAAPGPARATAIDALTEEKIRPHEDQFIRLFGNGPGSPQTDFFATSDQALYFENAGALRSWTQPGGGNLAERLAAITDPGAIAHQLYLAVLSRTPSPEEIAGIVSHLASRPPDQKSDALSDALWALLTSTEFRFKH